MVRSEQSVTVGIPYYGNTLREELAEAIDSILKQSRQPEEIHLIQDGPVTDDIANLVSGYLEQDQLFTHLVIAKQSGLAYALNISILHCNTNLYARMDSDDISHPRRLEKQLQYLEENPDIEMVGTWLLEFEGNINDLGNLTRKVPIEQADIYRLFHYRNPINHATIVFRRRVFAKIGIYNPDFTKAEDTELYARAFKKKIKVANLPEVLYYMRLSDMIDRRSTKEHIKYQALGRYKYNTWSIKLNLLKILSILFRLMPAKVQQIGYEKFKW